MHEDGVARGMAIEARMRAINVASTAKVTA